MFCFMFIVFFIGYLIIALIISQVFNSEKNMNLTSMLIYTFSFSIVYSLLSLKNYKKFTTKVIYEDIINKDIAVEVQRIMKKMHWSMIKNDNKCMVFKSSLWVTLWREYLEVTVNVNDLELVGPKYYVEKLVKRLT